MTTPVAIKVIALSPKATNGTAPVTSTRFGRIQRVILIALSEGRSFTTGELAHLAYDCAGAFELNSINRAIRHLIAKGFSLTCTRQGRVDASGFVYLWKMTP